MSNSQSSSPWPSLHHLTQWLTPPLLKFFHHWKSRKQLSRFSQHQTWGSTLVCFANVVLLGPHLGCSMKLFFADTPFNASFYPKALNSISRLVIFNIMALIQNSSMNYILPDLISYSTSPLSYLRKISNLEVLKPNLLCSALKLVPSPGFPISVKGSLILPVISAKILAVIIHFLSHLRSNSLALHIRSLLRKCPDSNHLSSTPATPTMVQSTIFLIWIITVTRFLVLPVLLHYIISSKKKSREPFIV